MSTPLFPVFLKLTGRHVLVVGGGRVACEKVAALLHAGARVTLVAPRVRAEIDAQAVRIVPRRFRPSDIDGHWFVVSAATPSVNRLVARAGARRQVFVNAVDDPAHADAYLGGVLRRDGVTIAVSTDGQAPALAGLLREGLDRLLPEDLARWVSRARTLRRVQRARGVPMSARRPQLLDALTALYRHRPQGPPS